MKKALFILLVLCLSFSVFAQGAQEAQSATTESAYSIAMITDSGDITDQSFNQSTYEACRDYAAAQGIKFQYYKPTGDSDEARIASIEKAIDDGFNVIVMPGYLFGAAIAKTAPQYSDVKFVALDVSEGDVGGAISNVYCMVYQEEIAGYLAGYATVALGYTNLGFCGGMAVPAVIRYGYGFVQGAEAAAAKLGKTGTIQYTYANQFFGDADVTAAMDTMYANGAEVVFACGGGVYTSVAEAAAKVGKKLVGVDVDQQPTIDGAYGAGITLTSAMKGLYASTQAALKTIVEDNAWDTVAGTFATLGLVSGTDMDANFVGIPTGDGTQWSDSFTFEDYKAVVNDIYTGKIVVKNDTSVAVTSLASVLTVKDLGNIK
jgi:basic membrane protein A and related proteins